MTATEFTIDLDADNEGLGTLFISDAHLLVRPRTVPGQYPASVPHDTVHSYHILCLGNDLGMYTTHIVYSGGPRAAHKLLDRVFYAYVDGECFSLWCDARVSYIVDGECVRVEEYGFEDGQYTMFIKVHCNVGEDDTEAFLATLTSQVGEDERFVVVRPDASSELGYAAQGFIVEQSADDAPVEDDQDDEDLDEDEDPLADDVEPTGGYYEAPVHPMDAHRLHVMAQHGDYLG